MTPLSNGLATAWKRLLTAALDQPWPTPELERALNHLLALKRSKLAPKEEK